MDYIRETIEKLEEHNLLLSAEENLRMEIKALILDKDCMKAQRLSHTPGGGSGSGEPDDKIANNIARRIELNNRLRCTRLRINQIKKAMECLEDKEKTVLEILYVNGSYKNIDYACQRLGYEKSNIYKLRDRSLRKLARALLGIGVA